MSNWLSMNAPDVNEICLEIDDLIEGFAVGALESDEMLRVANALDKCPGQAARLERLDETVGLLGLATASVPAPTQLWERIEASTKQSPVRDPIDIAARRKDRTLAVPRWLAAVVSAAAILLLISSVGLGVALRNANDNEDAMGDFESAMTTYMTSGGTMLTLASQAAPEYMTWPGNGTVLTAPDMPPVIFVDKCIPTESNDIEYYVWLQKDDVRTPMGQMEIGEDGKGMIMIEGIDSLADYDAIGISIRTRENKVYDLMEGWPAQEG